jgi:hypothetical protein
MTHFEGEWLHHPLQARIATVSLSCPSCWSSGVERHRHEGLLDEVETRNPLPGPTSPRAVSLDASPSYGAAGALPPEGARTVRIRRRHSFLATATIG